jgi:hypothetical protein
MRWDQGRAVIDRMLAGAELQRVPASRDHADRLISQARNHLTVISCEPVLVRVTRSGTVPDVEPRASKSGPQRSSWKFLVVAAQVAEGRLVIRRLQCLGNMEAHGHTRFRDAGVEDSQSGPARLDGHVVAERAVGVVMQAQAGNPVIEGMEWARGIFTEDGSEGVQERLPEVGPVAARSGRYDDVERDGPRG